MAKPVNTVLDFASGGSIINLPNATLPQSPATLSQVNSLVEGLAWKDNAVVATQANITLAGPGAAIDGITMVAGDRFVARAQTAQTENGIYIWNGAAVAATRSLDGTDVNELKNAVLTVDSGTSAGVTYRQTTITGVIGTANIVWVTFGTAASAASETVSGIAEIATQAETDAGTDDLRIVTPLKLKTSPFAAKRFSVTFGDGAATQYTIAHNLNSQDAVAIVRLATGTFAEVICDIEMTTVNSITIRFAVAPALNSMRATVLV